MKITYPYTGELGKMETKFHCIFGSVTCLHFVYILEFGMICPYSPGDPHSADCTGIGMMCNHDTNLCDCDTTNGWHYNGITCSQGKVALLLKYTK